jgi:uncharacterized protein YjbJ (UPF0337 family)
LENVGIEGDTPVGETLATPDKAKDIGGKIQEQVGKAVGSSEQQAKGMAKQVEGKVQEKAGDVKDAINKSGNR